MKQIYNEGRIIGLSAYDLYVRQLLSTNPEATPMTEREWLSTTLSESSSMILRVPAGTRSGVNQFPLPSNSSLCAATVIYGTVFQGEVTLSDDGFWAIRVDDYGELISNTHELHPVTPGQPEDVPTKFDPQPLTDRLRARCKEFLKIKSALVIQPGEWTDNIYYTDTETESGEDILTQDDEQVLSPVNDTNADRSLTPDFSKPPFIRMIISEKIKEDVLILLHGFAFGSILTGQVGFPIQGRSSRPQDGDFLGPAVFPWSTPIEFIVTSDVQSVIDEQADYRYKLLNAHVNYLGSLHTIIYSVPLITEDNQGLMTEDDETLVADKEGTVAEMWQEQGEDIVTYFIPTLTEDDEELDAEEEGVLYAPKTGTMEQMIVDGGIW